jgi:uracil-DNA glycosylase family 4
VKTTEEWFSGPPGYPAGTRIRRVQPEGRGGSGVLVLGESGGKNEAEEGLPFRPHAEAGSVLERALYRAGVSRDSLTISNLVPYRPPRDWLDSAPWEVQALEFGKKYLDQLVREVKPRAILALGGLPLREMTGLSGEKCGIGMTRGFIIPSVQYKMKWLDDGSFLGQELKEPTPFQLANGSPIPVIGSYHPSFLRRGSKERQESGPRGKVDAAGGGTQGMSLLGVLIRDIQLAVEVAKNGYQKFCPKPHILGASLEDWKRSLQKLRENREYSVYYDFETEDSLVASDESEMEIVRRNVTQVQIHSGGLTLVSDWFPELLPVLRGILQLPNRKIDWNGRKFDRPICREMGIRTDLGIWEDYMDYHHHSQPDLPRGLQFAASLAKPEISPWKHLSAVDPYYYGLIDVQVMELIGEYLNKSCGIARHPVSGISVLQGYQDQVVRLAPVLDRMSARGIPVDDVRRQELDREFTATLERLSEETQEMFPDVLRSCSPKKGYVRTPEELLEQCGLCHGAKKIRNYADLGTCGACDLKADALPKSAHGLDCPQRHGPKNVPCSNCSGTGKVEAKNISLTGWVIREFEDEVSCGCPWSKKGRKQEVLVVPVPDCSKCQNTGKVVSRVLRWCRLEEFKPGSWQQVLRYIEWKLAQDIEARARKLIDKGSAPESARALAEQRTEWYIPADHKTGKPTTGEDELRRLAKKTGDLLLPKILEHREIDKARGTYVRGWKPGPDGCVHSSFGFKPATGQMSSENPNVQNYYSHGELAQKMKAMIVSRFPEGVQENA